MLCDFLGKKFYSKLCCDNNTSSTSKMITFVIKLWWIDIFVFFLYVVSMNVENHTIYFRKLFNSLHLRHWVRHTCSSLCLEIINTTAEKLDHVDPVFLSHNRGRHSMAQGPCCLLVCSYPHRGTCFQPGALPPGPVSRGQGTSSCTFQTGRHFQWELPEPHSDLPHGEFLHTAYFFIWKTCPFPIPFPIKNTVF